MPELSGYFLSLSIVLFVALAGSFIAKKLQKPSIVLFIILGIFLQNFAPWFKESIHVIAPLANLGVVLLLLSIGLELPLYRLFRSGKHVVYAALMQLSLSSIFMYFTIYFFFRDVRLALILASVMALSSTAVVGKLLQEQGEDTSLAGNLTLGILIFQDLFSVLLITFFTLMVQKGAFVFDMGLLGELTTKVAAVAGVVFVSSKIMDKIFTFERFHREELTLFTFAALFFFLWFFAKLAIPETTAGFIIGVMLASRIEQHEIFSQVRIVRDVLLVLFFFFLGTYITSLNFKIIIASALFAVFIMFVKLVVNWLGFLLLGFHRKTAYWMSFDLMQAGEFSFVILSILAAAGFIPAMHYQFFLLVVVWSLLLFSFFYKSKLALYSWLDTYAGRHFSFLERFSETINQPTFEQLPLRDHIVLCGYGRVGSYVGHGLALSKLPLVVVDTDAAHVKKLTEKGITAIYGDATEMEILDFAQVEHARFLIVAVPSYFEQEKIIVNAKRLNPNIQIFTRSHLASYLKHLRLLGIKFIYQPEFEAAVSILKKIMNIYHFDKQEIKKRIHYLKIEHGLAQE